MSKKEVAIKIIEKSYMRDEHRKRKVFQEIYISKRVRHPNVIRFLEVFESNKQVNMVLEHASGGDLLRLVKKRKRLDEA